MATPEGGQEATAAEPLSEIFAQHPVNDGAEKEEKEEASQKFPEGESSSDESDEKKDDDKSDKPKEDADESDEKKDAKAPDKTPDGKPKEDKSSDEDKAKADKAWEDDKNPYKKRFQDTSANWNRVHQENLQLHSAVNQMQQEMSTLRKIADGTYDPEKDDPAKRITPEAVANNALSIGKTLASRNAAISQFGEETVNANLNEFNQLFENHADIQRLVINADAPVYEAFRILDRYKFEQKYGSTPADIEKNIRAAVEKELRESIRKEVAEELMGKIDKKKSHPSFASSRGSNGVDKGAKPKSTGPAPLKDIFGR